MCERLGQFRQAIGRDAASFDPTLLSCEQAATVVAEAAAIEKMADLEGIGRSACR